MAEYILLMHNDATDRNDSPDWDTYLAKLRTEGVLRGGSAIGSGTCMKLDGPAADLTEHIVGYITVAAETLDQACQLVTGNPIYQSGGTVEVRELPRTS